MTAETIRDDAARNIRLRAQGLLHPTAEAGPEALVAGLVGVQAQDVPGAGLSLWARSADLHKEHLSQAVRERRIVRTWAMRGTLHLLSASDVRWVLTALSPARVKPSARHVALGLDADTFGRAESILREALRGGRQSTRAELGEALQARGVAPEGQRLPHILGRLSLQSVLCQGPPRGTEPTYTLLDDWLPAEEPMERAEALSRLARRYITGYGLANSRDLAMWSGISLDEGRGAWRLIESEITFVVVRGTHYAVLKSACEESAPTNPTPHGVRLLPGFDNWLLGYGDRRLNLDPAYAKRVNAGGGMPKPTLVVNGQVAGVWSRAIRRRRLAVSITLFDHLSRDAKDTLAVEATRLGQFLELATDLTVTGPE